MQPYKLFNVPFTATTDVILFKQLLVGKGFVNTALTGSTALNLILSPFSYYWATAAAAIAAAGFFDIAGLIVIIPGNQIAIGATSALTAATWDCSLIWEETNV
jgi:hypothetical protein